MLSIVNRWLVVAVLFLLQLSQTLARPISAAYPLVYSLLQPSSLTATDVFPYPGRHETTTGWQDDRAPVALTVTEELQHSPPAQSGAADVSPEDGKALLVLSPLRRQDGSDAPKNFERLRNGVPHAFTDSDLSSIHHGSVERREDSDVSSDDGMLFDDSDDDNSDDDSSDDDDDQVEKDSEENDREGREEEAQAAGDHNACLESEKAGLVPPGGCETQNRASQLAGSLRRRRQLDDGEHGESTAPMPTLLTASPGNPSDRVGTMSTYDSSTMPANRSAELPSYSAAAVAQIPPQAPDGQHTNDDKSELDAAAAAVNELETLQARRTALDEEMAQIERQIDEMVQRFPLLSTMVPI